MALKTQQEQLQLQQQQYASMAKCPRCGSTSLSGNKKGFGIGKAVVGAALIGPLGLVAGNIGAHKVQVTCLNCGKKFKLYRGSMLCIAENAEHNSMEISVRIVANPQKLCKKLTSLFSQFQNSPK